MLPRLFDVISGAKTRCSCNYVAVYYCAGRQVIAGLAAMFNMKRPNVSRPATEPLPGVNGQKNHAFALFTALV